MKIIVDLRSLGGHPWSGVPLYTRELVHALTQEFPDNEWIGYSSGRAAGSVLAGGITQYWTQPSSNALRTLRWNLPGSVWRNHFNVDLYFLPNWNILPARIDTPLVLTIHDLSSIRLPWDGGWKRRAWHKSIRIQRLLAQARILLCVSQATAQELKTFVPEHASKIRIVPLAVRTTVPHVCSHYCERWKNASAPLVVMMSDRPARKNSIACLRSLSVVTVPHQTIVVGAGIARADPSTRLVGPLSPPQFDALLSHARLLVYPSLYEGFGFPPREALARGVPVAIAASPALAEVSGTRSWLMNPLDHHQMQSVMTEAITIPRTVHTLSSRTWNDVARETWSVFQEAL